uniref:DnaJ isogeny subfamily B member 14 n=1 Tax=Cajanus cajan TaxID=3821 RepID=A0A151TR76_CAJCA|nr:DnaJ isogeny subfamily B member 14 [Cajanus cajan]
MECNKDDASRAKELAGKMLLQKDFDGARRLAMKALQLYPKLDGLAQLLTTIEVYISAEKKVDGEFDWYRILGVQPLANEETIRRRYRKLALTLHPDKNKSVGADGAFNLISQAWSYLSDKAKRISYDQKYNSLGIYRGNHGGIPSVPASQNGVYNNNVFNPVMLMKQHNFNCTRMESNHVSGRTPTSAVNSSLGSASQNEGINLANGFGSQKNSFDTGRVNAAGNYKRNGVRDVSQLQLRSILVEKARKEILKKLDEWSASSASKNLDKSKKTDTDIKEKKGKERAITGVKPGPQEFVDSETVSKKCFSADPEPELPGSLSMNVPDPDFHDFDGDRIENAFGENQVWAAYDNDDGMPRYYCLIHEVISKNPFNMRISWLNAKSNDELAPIKWISDVWALYRNWSLDWTEFTDDEIIQKYDMVEVLEDYIEDQGVNVAPLVKVAGFKTVFRQNVDPRKVRNISKVEMFRFSHQVPSYLLTGEEGHNAPKGCLELDPAATPMELLQVFAEDLEQEIVMPTEKPVEDELKQKENSGEDGLVDKGEGSDEGMGEKRRKPEILFVYKRRRLGKKKELGSGK